MSKSENESAIRDSVDVSPADSTVSTDSTDPTDSTKSKDGKGDGRGLNLPDNRPTIESARLILRPFQMNDAERVHDLINDREIASNTRTIEYPYPDGAAELWISQHADFWRKGDAAIFGICWRDGECEEEQMDETLLVGAIGLEICKTNHHAELGYWIGRPYWGKGFCTEAATRVIQFGFEVLGLHKVHAHHLTRNPASGRVLEKAGMVQEGLCRGHIRKWGVFEDVVLSGILRREWEEAFKA